MLTNGPVLAEDHTLEVSPGERTRIATADTGILPGTPVWRLTYAHQ